MGFKKTVFVVLVGFVVFLTPGIILAHLTQHIEAVKVMAFCIVFSMFFHPLQLLVVDWVCNFEGFHWLDK